MNSKIQQKLIIFLIFSIFGLFILIPFIAIVISSFKDTQDLFRSGLNIAFVSENLTFDNYINLFVGDNQYFTWYGNSIAITVIQVFVMLLLSAGVAYGFSMYNFKLKKVLFIFVLVQMMVPFEIMMLPLYQTIINMKLLDTFAGIILPAIVSPFLILFFRQYLESIPKDYLDAARIDGCNEYRIFFAIFIPIMKPAVVTMGIFSSIGAWNNFLWPLIVLSSPDKFTLPIGLLSLLTPYGNNFEILISGAALAILPILVLFLIFRRAFTEAMTAGGIKG